MGKMRCRFGHEMHLTGVDSPYEFSLVPEYVIEKYLKKSRIRMISHRQNF